MDSEYISDEEISTNKENHSRLGEDNMDDTLVYDFGGLPLKGEKLEELQGLDSISPADQDTSHIVETEVKEGPSLLLKDPGPIAPMLPGPIAPMLPAPSCVPVSICPSFPCSCNMDVPGILEMKDTVATSEHSVERSF